MTLAAAATPEAKETPPMYAALERHQSQPQRRCRYHFAGSPHRHPQRASSVAFVKPDPPEHSLAGRIWSLKP